MMIRLLSSFLLAAALAAPLAAAPKKAPAAKGAEGSWLKVPDAWLVNRFVQSNVGPRNSYRVGLLLPPGAKTPKVTKSSGRDEVDGLAFDYAKHLLSQNAQLREMGKTKELVFNFELIPPVLDAGEKSEAGREPIPAGKKFHTPTPPILYYAGANKGGAAFLTNSTFKVIFPAAGGYAKEAIVTSSSGDLGRDLFYIRNAVINWKTSAVSDRPIVLSFDMNSRSLGPRNY